MAKTTTLSIVSILIILAASSWLLLRAQIPGSGNLAVPVFTFNQTLAPGWFNTSNYNSQANVDPETYDESISEPINQLPIASTGVHHNGPDNTDQHPDNCFVLFSYYDYPLDDILAAYTEYEERMNTWGSFEQLGVSEQTITTPEGDKLYHLCNYQTIVDGGSNYMSGNQIGFVALSSGHIRIQGVCQTAKDLHLSTAILSSVQLRLP